MEAMLSEALAVKVVQHLECI